MSVKMDNLKEENQFLQANVSALRSRVYDYSDALEEANDNIRQANSTIEDAQSYAWYDYRTMGETLENLETVSEIDEP